MSAWGQDASLLSRSSYGATVGWQCVAVLVTLAAASVGGTLAGAIVSSINPAKQSLGPHQLFDDGAFWTVRVLSLRIRVRSCSPVVAAVPPENVSASRALRAPAQCAVRKTRLDNPIFQLSLRLWHVRAPYDCFLCLSCQEEPLYCPACRDCSWVYAASIPGHQLITRAVFVRVTGLVTERHRTEVTSDTVTDCRRWSLRIYRMNTRSMQRCIIDITPATAASHCWLDACSCQSQLRNTIHMLPGVAARAAGLRGIVGRRAASAADGASSLQSACRMGWCRRSPAQNQHLSV